MSESLRIIQLNPELAPFSGDLFFRLSHYYERKKELLGDTPSLWEFAAGAHYFGFHRSQTGWVYREWAPGAQQMHLIGDFNGWDRKSHPMQPVGNGNWEIVLEGADALPHNSNVKVAVTSARGTEDRIPL